MGLRIATVVALGAAAVLPPQGPLPDTASFMREAVQALRADDRIQEQFTYIEESRDVKISRFGKVTVGPMQRYEVFPSAGPGGTYKRLIAVDGRPLTPKELAGNDEKHQRDLLEDAERRRRESPAERARRVQQEQEARDGRQKIIDDAIAVFDARVEGREYFEGQPIVRVALTPRPGARTQTREGAWARQFAGLVWFSEHNQQLVRAEVTAQDDVSIGWGIVGRIHRGSRLSLSRRLFNDAWLPGTFIFEASGRTLLFRRFDLVVERTYSGYRRLDTQAVR